MSGQRATLLVVVDPGVRAEHPWVPEVCPAGAVIGPLGEQLFVHADGQSLYLNRGGSRGTRSSARGGAS